MTTAKSPARYGAMWGAPPGGFALPTYTITRDTTAEPRRGVQVRLVGGLDDGAALGFGPD
ncbi:hypothetical protein JQ615_41685 [Bradyrhizobium jicamae]|uniref:Uncharacterized protein n=1 Tax=Bradyrhizobium jicamae TaxID=280332 RepID=A0ABS5FYD2_9BRAD|nr:hypothetical protein [Bradyrhizobium jicamae]